MTPLQPRDLFSRVLVRPEQRIRLGRKGSSGSWFWVLRKVWTDVFPTLNTVGRDFEKPSESRFAQKRIAIRQTLRGSHKRRIERFLDMRRDVHPIFAVTYFVVRSCPFPNNLLGFPIDLDGTRILITLSMSESSIIKYLVLGLETAAGLGDEV